ncbi:hypothetical protein ACIQPP_36765 [Streptomyces violaceusniger]
MVFPAGSWAAFIDELKLGA